MPVLVYRDVHHDTLASVAAGKGLLEKACQPLVTYCRGDEGVFYCGTLLQPPAPLDVGVAVTEGVLCDIPLGTWKINEVYHHRRHFAIADDVKLNG